MTEDYRDAVARALTRQITGHAFATTDGARRLADAVVAVPHPEVVRLNDELETERESRLRWAEEAAEMMDVAREALRLARTAIAALDPGVEDMLGLPSLHDEIAARLDAAHAGEPETAVGTAYPELWDEGCH